MLSRAVYLLKVYVLTVVFFMGAKVVFMLANGSGLSLADYAAVLWHGLSLDLSTALYFIFLPFLACLVSLWVKVPRRFFSIYFAIVSLAFSLAFVADTSLYSFWHFKLDASCLQYLATPTEAMASVSTGYMLVRLLLLIVSAVAMAAIYCIVNPRFTAVRHRVAYTAVMLLAIPLLVIGIRGGLDESTTNVGQTYFSQRQLLNHSAVNPVFSFLSSFEKTANNIVDYDFLPDDECSRLIADVYPQAMSPSDTLLTTSRPDIVVVLMESAGSIMSDAMPRLEQLKGEGISFSRCIGNTWRTDRGTVCTYSGYPSFPTSSVMKMPSKTQYLPGIARTLRDAGYQTSYFYGGDINFTNMRSYLVGTGFEALTWKKDYSASEQSTSKWGVRDDIMFDAVYDKLTSPHTQPLLIGFSTLSSHEPWDVPLKKLDDPIKNAFYYLDDCIGRFVDRLRSTPQWKQTLIVLLPDHSIDYGDFNEMVPERNYIPLLWVGGAVAEPMLVDKICNQTDLAATLLSQLSLPHADFRWSRDVLSPSYRYPVAVHNFNNGFSVTDSTGFMVYDLNSRQTVVSQTTQAGRLERLGKAVLQATTADLKHLGNN